MSELNCVRGAGLGGSFFLAIGLIILFGCRPVSAWQIDPDLPTVRENFRELLHALVTECQEQNLADEAEVARQAIINRDPNRQYIFLPPAESPAIDENASAAVQAFHKRYYEIRKQHAEDLFQQAKIFAGNKNGSQAYQLMHEALVYDPDHVALRSLLGFKKHYALGWVRSTTATQARKARVQQVTIGWPKGTYWTIKSPHFKIYSAAGEQAGLELAAELEQTWMVWRQVFFDYWCSNEQLNRWLEGKGTDRAHSRQYDVILFRDRTHYLSDLADVPNITISSGYYIEKQEASFFYAAPEPEVENWRHETVHQLLQENAGRNDTVADRGHAWMVEGVAMYFESMQTHDQYVTLGGFDALRLQYARLRCKREGFYLPLESLDQMDRTGLQNHRDARKIYSQSAGISQFLFTAEGGRYRKGFIRFIKEFYQDRRHKSRLDERTGPFDQLDRQYAEFLQVDPQEWKNYFTNRNTVALALGRTGLKDEDIKHLEDCTNLEWLELSANPIGDDALVHLSGLTGITQLFLDETGVTDAAADRLARMSSLQEIDLASNRITDAGIKPLAALPDLQVLWLANTTITDKSIETFLAMPKLDLLDIRQTAITKAAITRLKSLKPDLTIME